MGTVMTLEEVAAFLRVHPSTIYRLLKKHRIPAFKLGSDWRFNQESIERWIAARESENPVADSAQAQVDNELQLDRLKSPQHSRSKAHRPQSRP
jgi:excisionase family DNA binding protein